VKFLLTAISWVAFLAGAWFLLSWLTLRSMEEERGVREWEKREIERAFPEPADPPPAAE